MRIQKFSFVLLMVFGFIVFGFSSSLYAAEAIGQVVWANGGVQAIGADNSARTLTRRAPIFENDTIVTSASGSGQIVFTDSSAMTLRGGTSIKIDAYKFNAASPSDGKYVATLAKGGFRTITGYISKGNPDSYEVNTPVATIGVRGTDYSIFYSPSTGLAAGINRGAIFVFNSAGKIELRAGTQQAFAQVNSLHASPAVSNVKPATLKTTLTIKPASVLPPGGPGSTPPSGGTPAVPGATDQQNVTPTGGPKKSVSSFCVG